MFKPNTDLQNNPPYYDITGTKNFPLHQSSYQIKSSVEHMGEIGKKGTHSNCLYKKFVVMYFLFWVHYVGVKGFVNQFWIVVY